jgi:hypothetical protein
LGKLPSLNLKLPPLVQDISHLSPLKTQLSSPFSALRSVKQYRSTPASQASCTRFVWNIGYHLGFLLLTTPDKVKMPANFKSEDAQRRLLTAVIAAHPDLKLNFKGRCSPHPVYVCLSSYLLPLTP